MCKKLVLLISSILLLAVGGLSGLAHAATVTGTHQTAVINTDWAATAQDITAVSTDGDWRLWEAFGAPAYEKNTPRELIGDLEQIGAWGTYNSPGQNFAWSDGVEPISTTSTGARVCSSEGQPDNEGYQVNVTIPSGRGTITVWAGTRYATGVLSILDGSAVLFSMEGNNNGQIFGFDRFDLEYSEFIPGTVITITWINTSGTGSARGQFYGVAISAGEPLTKAYSPTPANEAIDVIRDVSLNWVPGVYVDKHDVYLGTSFDDVNLAMPTDAVYLGRVDSNSYPDTGTIRLGFDETYYWRVDEVNAPPDSTVYKGEVWQFTAEPFAVGIPGGLITATASSNAPDQGPEKTIDSSGLDANDLHSSASSDMWLTAMGEPVPAWIQYEFDKLYKLNEMLVWNYNAESILAGLGLKDVTIEYSTDGSAWTQLDGAFEFQQAPGAAGYASDISVDFAGIAARFVKIAATSNYLEMFPQYGLSEVRFMTIPVSAREPSPADEAMDVAVDAALSWRAGREAAEHKVSLSTDLQAVIDGTAPVTTVSQTSYSPALDLGSTFFWQIEEVNNAETPTTWQSDIWNFATQEYIVVDDFESYNDIPEGEEGSNLVYITWEDGYANPATNGSTMGYVTGESMETGNVYGGEQSAPLFYNNTSASSSEVTVDLGKLPIGRNWSKGSPQALVLWIHGDPGNTGNDRLYVKIGNSKFPYDGDIARPQWKPVVVDLTGVNLNNVSSLTIGIERSGGSGGSGIVFIDDIVLAATAPAVPSEEVWIEAESADSIQAPMMTFDDPNASGGQYIMKDPDVEPSYDSPPADGLVTYQFTVAGGTYTIAGRVITDGMNDGLWFRIPEATMNVEGDPSNPGWIEWNGMTSEDVWGWDDVFSSNNDNVTVEFTLDAGTYTIEIRYRDDATQLDALVIARID